MPEGGAVLRWSPAAGPVLLRSPLSPLVFCQNVPLYVSTSDPGRTSRRKADGVCPSARGGTPVQHAGRGWGVNKQTHRHAFFLDNDPACRFFLLQPVQFHPGGGCVYARVGWRRRLSLPPPGDRTVACKRGGGYLHLNIRPPCPQCHNRPKVHICEPVNAQTRGKLLARLSSALGAAGFLQLPAFPLTGQIKGRTATKRSRSLV